MLYMEDFLELIDQLPLELRDRFTDIRTLDLQVQNDLDKNEELTKELFAAAPSLTPEERKARYDQIKSKYREIVENADEKVGLAGCMHDLVERYQRRLDAQVARFKLELEADNPGVTAQLEQKVRNSEQASRTQRRERLKRRRVSESGGGSSAYEKLEALTSAGSISSMIEALRQTAQAHGIQEAQLAHHILHAPRSSQFLKPMFQRRPQTHPSRLSDIKALNANPPFHQPRDKPPPPATVASSSSAGATSGASAAKGASFGAESRHGRPRKLATRVQEMLKETMERGQRRRRAAAAEYTEDADQRRWCICNQTSYGEMVACDNPQCPFEWFHYDCVNVTQPPKGKWFCPHCLDSLKRRKLQTQ